MHHRQRSLAPDCANNVCTTCGPITNSFCSDCRNRSVPRGNLEDDDDKDSRDNHDEERDVD